MVRGGLNDWRLERFALGVARCVSEKVDSWQQTMAGQPPRSAAMIDLGLSYQQIATYFAVAPDDVRMLCELYNLFAASSE